MRTDQSPREPGDSPSESSGGTMRAAVVAEPGVLRVEEVPVPEPGQGEVRVRLQGCGVCASNLPPWEGRPWFNYPLEPGALGHEGWGVVERVGPGVIRFGVGDRVAMLSQHAYAECDVVSDKAVVKLPESLGSRPFPGEPLGCAMNIFRRSEIDTGQMVAVVGIGFLGAILTRLASTVGARVIAISRRPCALEMARCMGAEETIPLENHWEIIERVRELTGGSFCDVTVEAVGLQWPLDLAAELTRERGRMIVAGYHQDGMRQVNMQLWNWRGLDVINAHEREQEVYIDGMQIAVDAVAGGLIDPAPLCTHVFPLDALAEALNMTAQRPEGFMKALVTM